METRDYSRIKEGLEIEIFEKPFGWFRALVEKVENEGFMVRAIEGSREGATAGVAFKANWWRFIGQTLDPKDLRIQELEKEIERLKRELAEIKDPSNYDRLDKG